MRNALFFLVFLSVIFSPSCGLIHFGQGSVEVWIDHTPVDLPLQSATVFVQSVKLGFMGHGDVEIPITPVEINLVGPSSNVFVGSFDLDAGSYDKIILTFKPGTVIYNDAEYEIELNTDKLEINYNFELEEGTKKRIFITIDGSSLSMEEGQVFKFNPVVYVSVE